MPNRMAIEKEHYSLLAAICASLFCTPLMVSGVNAVLPELGKGLDAGATELSLVGVMYSLGLAVFQLACGSMGDIKGHRRLFLCGAAIFGISGAILGFLHSMPLFLALRFIQGAGGAIISATGLALLAACAPPDKRPYYLGVSGAAVYAGIACGPPVAGFITGAFGWRWLFWGNSIACLAVFLLMRFAVKHEWRPAAMQKFDWQGGMFYAIAMAALICGSAKLAHDPAAGWFFLSVFAIFLCFFFRRETHCAFPMLNMKLMGKNRVLTLSSIAAYVNYASFFGLIFYFSIYVQVGKGFSVRETGLVLAFQPFVQVLCTPVAARLCAILPSGHVSAAGAGICGLGLMASAFLRLDSSIFLLFLAQALLGGGISLFSLANTSIMLESAGKEFVGQASALVGAVRTAGQLCGMVLITLTLSLFMGNQAVSPDTMPGFMRSLRLDLIIFGALNILAVGIALVRNRQ